jgi:hypothetical protein
MKRIFLLSSSIFLFLLFSCKKDENKVYLEGGVAPTLTSSVVSVVPLANATKNEEAVKFVWTNPNYKFNTGISSQNVNYSLQIDTAGANFSSKLLQTVSTVSKDLGVSITQYEMNVVLLKMGFDFGVPRNVEFRLIASLGSVTETKQVSNVVKLSVTPFYIPPVLPYPTTGELFLVGDATNGGWSNPVPVPTQQFTKIDSGLFQITLPLNGGKEYLFLPKNGDWSHKYACKDKKVSGLNAGGDFLPDASDNFPGPSAGGNYKIIVNFHIGTFSVVAQ